MREIRPSGSEGGGFELNRLSLPLSKAPSPAINNPYAADLNNRSALRVAAYCPLPTAYCLLP